jgi:hypothetical protein
VGGGATANCRRDCACRWDCGLSFATAVDAKRVWEDLEEEEKSKRRPLR